MAQEKIKSQQSQNSQNTIPHQMEEQLTPEQIKAITDEYILVVERETLFGTDKIDGLLQGVVQENISKYEEVIKEHAEFMPRPLMEQDERYKQIIPYLVFMHDDKLFLMQRAVGASEARLAGLYSLGIGGHVRKKDIADNDIADWGAREFAEEVNYDGNLKITPLGILNDDSNAVGRVHLGFVFLLRGDSANISVKSELQSGELYTLDECEQYYDQMESWSKMVFDLLKSARYI